MGRTPSLCQGVSPNYGRAGPLHLGRLGGPRQTWNLIPIPACHVPDPSLRWAMGGSLQEGNGFLPETTEPLFSPPTPICAHLGAGGTSGVLGGAQAPFPQGRLPQTLSHPSVLSSRLSLSGHGEIRGHPKDPASLLRQFFSSLSVLNYEY